MSYFIRPLLPKVGELQEIDEAEYKKIIQARKLAWDILLVKEHFSYIARNFVLLENEIKKIETEANKDLKDDLEEFGIKLSTGNFKRENIHILNLLVINLLTTCRTYLDLFDYQGQNEQREAFSEEEEIRRSLERIKEQYHRQDDILCIFFWTLRNYAQHHAQPVTGSPSNINGQGVKIDLSIDAEKVFSTLTEKKLGKLKELNISDPINNLKAYIEKNIQHLQLSEYPKKLYIRVLINKYIALLKQVNDEFNKEFSPKLRDSKSIISQKIKDYCHNNSPENNSSKSAFKLYIKSKESENSEKCFDISLESINQWEEIIEKYSNLDFIDN
jgi:hypothetical protein